MARNNIIDATLRFVDRFTAPMGAAINNLERHGRQIQKTGRQIQKTGDSISKVGKGLSKAITLPVIGLGIAAIETGIDFESAFAGVKKTISATPEELDKISNSLRDMAKDIPISVEGLAKIAESAGQLGIETPNVLKFTEVMAALSVSTNLTGEEAASALAKFANVTGMDQKNFDKLGSVIVELGNNFATTEADIVAMGTRLSGAGTQIGLSEAEIMGFSTALSSVGIEAEMGGSAFSKAMTKMKVASATGLTKVQEISKKTGMSLRDMQLMSDNDSMGFKAMAQDLGMTKTELNNVVKSGVELEHFSKIAGMTTSEFKNMFDANPGKALDSFIKGLGNTKKHGKSTIEMLQDMGFTEVRLRDSLTRLANNNDGVTKAMEMGNKAWEDNSALAKEAEQRYATTESQLKILGNSIKDVGIDVFNILSPSFNKIIKKIGGVVEKFSNLDDGTKKSIVKFALMAAAVGPTIFAFGKITKGVGNVITKFGGLLTKLRSAGNLFALLKTPSVIAVGALAAVAVAAFLIIKNWDKIKKVFEENKKTIIAVATIIATVFAPALAKTALKATLSFTKALLSNGKQIVLNAARMTKNGVVAVAKYVASGWKSVAVLAKQSAMFVINTAKLVAHKAAVIGVTAAQKLWALGTGAVRLAQMGLNAAFVASPIGWIVLGIAAVIAVGVLLVKNWGKVKKMAKIVWEGVKEIFSPIGKWFGGIWDGVKSGFKAFINFILKGLNKIPEGLNKLNIDIPDWVPGVGGKNLGFKLPTIPLLYKGTNNWAGGPAMIHDKGAEIVDLPNGSRVYPHDKSLSMAKAQGVKAGQGQGKTNINIAKLADSIIVREEADIDRIVESIVKKLEAVSNNMGGGIIGDMA